MTPKRRGYRLDPDPVRVALGLGLMAELYRWVPKAAPAPPVDPWADDADDQLPLDHSTGEPHDH